MIDVIGVSPNDKRMMYKSSLPRWDYILRLPVGANLESFRRDCEEHGVVSRDKGFELDSGVRKQFLTVCSRVY